MYYRETQARDSGSGMLWADCNECKRTLSRARRGDSYGCGFVPEAERCDYAMRPPMTPHEASVCVGYTCSLPQVLQAGRLLSWREDGQLGILLDGEELTQAAATAMDIVAIERNRARAYATLPADRK